MVTAIVADTARDSTRCDKSLMGLRLPNPYRDRSPVPCTLCAAFAGMAPVSTNRAEMEIDENVPLDDLDEGFASL